MKKTIKYILYLIGFISLLIGILISYIICFLPHIPVEHIKVQITPTRIERGRYLVNHVTVCFDCHSTNDWTKYSGPIVPNTEGQGGCLFYQRVGLPGKYISPNITPYKLKDWTDGEIFRAITCGVSKDGKALFPLMPYQNFGQMDKEDIYSIIAYLKTIRPIRNKVPASKSDFPINIIIHTIPKKAEFSSKPDTIDKISYGKYLVNAAGCKNCHTKLNKGKYEEGLMFAGGVEFKFPFGTITSANITPDKQTGIGNWTKEAFLTWTKSYDIAGGYVPKELKPTEFNTIIPLTSYAGMTKSDLSAIYDYLHSLKPVYNKIEKVKYNNLYIEYCNFTH